MIPHAVIYSSRTGNTKRLAGFAASYFGIPMMDVRDASGLPEGVPLMLGAWTRRGAPDENMAAFMNTLSGRDIFFFCTMAAYTDSPHAAGCLARAKEILESAGCRLAGHFLCRGRMDPAVLARSRHPMTPERRERLRTAENRPNEDDGKRLIEAVKASFFYR